MYLIIGVCNTKTTPGLKGVIILWNGMEHSMTLFSGMEQFVKQLIS